ncbi:P-loop NTPase fold protein [Peribacillus sp. AS_2]|uniref:KAP family P-loop NTPase fold protein n=1 Tax=Peribacillus sp. AS_2 TaxID=2996755 RepID=UPI0022A7720F|nr:P-loop NTPase fold protein [Peribacillus sp. AS_2]MCZ0871261.1 P-loop NTPase fold protein [Peribacillus sp. AS_2]
MFISDRPITKPNEDILDRKAFSKHLGDAICDWKENESLVIALNGEWGVGKSSIINIALDQINDDISIEKPTVITFNPWIYSDLNNLTTVFFQEISKELELQNQTIKDKEIAQKLRLYSSLLNVIPNKTIIKTSYNKLIIGLGLAGISLSTLSKWLGISNSTLEILLFLAGAGLILTELTKETLTKLSGFFETRSITYEKTAIDVKQEIISELLNRNKKLVIVIDDIDRLTSGEIKEIFRLIKINADFPNTIYLLSFDKEVVEKNLDVSLGVSGKKYMEKIVQVTFDVPNAKTEYIHQYLFNELDRILSRLPDSAKKYFSSESSHWANVFQSGIKCFFKNLRHVKRFVSSLELNLLQMCRDDVIEVNPVDFIAIESIRVFVPEFHNFMKQNKELFTSTRNHTDSSRHNNDNQRQKSLKENITQYTGQYEEYITRLLKHLFPQLEGVIESGYSSYGSDWIPDWTRNLRVCSPTHFDSYFVYLPKGSSDEISQYDLENILKKINNKSDFETELIRFLKNEKINGLLELLQNYTNDQAKIPSDCFKNIIVPLLDIIDYLPPERTGIFDISEDMNIMRIIYQLLKRENNQENNYELLRDAVLHSTSLYGIVKNISLGTPKNGEEDSNMIKLVKDEHLSILKALCVKKIKESANDNTLIENDHLPYILYRLKEWDKSVEIVKFVDELITDEQSLLKFLSTFKNTSFSSSIGNYGTIKSDYFDIKSLNYFVPDSETIIEKLTQIKKNNNLLYEEYIEIIDLFLDSYGSDSI